MTTEHTSDQLHATPTSDSQRRATALFRVAQIATIASGLTLTVYALTAFNQPDWTVAGPGVMVALGGMLSIVWRWALLVGLLPASAIFSVAGPILAFDLNRPDELSFFIGSAVILCTSIPAAILSIAALAQPHAGLRATAAYSLLAIVATIGVGAVVLGQQSGSRNRGADLAASQRDGAIEVDMIDYAYLEDRIPVWDSGTVLHLVNRGTLPHNMYIPSLDMTVFVPSGRDSYVEIPASAADDQQVWCTIGDHRQMGMTAVLAPA